jgi:hypothetical protein
MFEKQIALCLFGHIIAAEVTEGTLGDVTLQSRVEK